VVTGLLRDEWQQDTSFLMIPDQYFLKHSTVFFFAQDPRGSRLPVPLRALSAASFGIGAVLALAGYLVPRRRDVIAMAAAAGAPAAGAPRPTLADTKAKFLALSDQGAP